jgi:AcrR family transcriptional regulator
MHRSGAGDPARTLELLWRRPAARPTGKRGPRSGLGVDEVVATAVRVADAEGLDAASMRRVAQELGVTAMSLYTYVPGKAELLDLMLDAVHGAMAHSERADLPWRARLTAVADDNRALYGRHAWLAEVSMVRPPLGPGFTAKYERELRAFDGLGLADVEVDAALTFLLGFVRTTARAAAEAQGSRLDSAMSDAQWWAANGPLLARVFDAEKYPTAARVGAAAGAEHGAAYSPDHMYAFGLARVLDGLGAMIEGEARQRRG